MILRETHSTLDLYCPVRNLFAGGLLGLPLSVFGGVHALLSFALCVALVCLVDLWVMKKRSGLPLPWITFRRLVEIEEDLRRKVRAGEMDAFAAFCTFEKEVGAWTQRDRTYLERFYVTALQEKIRIQDKVIAAYRREGADYDPLRTDREPILN